MRPLVVATVQVGNYAGHGQEYLTKYYDGIRRHMPRDIEWRGVCFTDDPATVPEGVEARQAIDEPPSWWHKLNMLSPDAFEPGERIFFADLDVIPTGDLRDLATYDGKFAAMRDPFYPMHLGSAVMAWEAGALDHVWARWNEAGRPQFDPRGDQFWIERTATAPVEFWQDFLPEQIVSYKANCVPLGRIPDNTRICIFHGAPRPHECDAPYIQRLWNG